MKKILLLIISLLALAVLFNACEEEEDDFYSGVQIVVSNPDYYILDSEVTGNVATSRSSVEIDVTLNGEFLATITTQDGSAPYAFSAADLGNLATGESTTLKFAATVDGNPASHMVDFEVVNPILIDAPEEVKITGDTILKIPYQLEEDCTAPTSMTIRHSVNSGDTTDITGTYGYAGTIEEPVTMDNLDDTLHYHFTYSNSNGTVSKTHTIILVGIKYFYDFEGYEAWVTEFDPWTIEDKDGLAQYTIADFDYPGAGEPAAWRIFDWTATDPAEVDGWEAHSGNKYAFSMASSGGDDDDWMTSEGYDIEDGYSLSLYAKSITDAYGLERLIVKVINTDDDSETVLTPDPYAEVPTAWTNYTWDLSAWADENVKISIGCVSSDAFALFIDDFEIVTESGKSVFKNDFENSSTLSVTPKKVRP